MNRAAALVISLAVLSMNLGIAKPGNPEQEIAELTKLALGEDPQAELALGMRYRDGRGVAKDQKEAMKWYRRCADRGSAEGMDNVGFMYLRGWGVPENFEIAAGYFRASAKMNHPQGIYNLGNCYFSGQGVEQDYSQAIEWWQRAAKSGHPNATWRLATLYASGEGLAQDLGKAWELCEPIAKQGHVNAMLLLGEIGAKQGDGDTARKWWKKAGERGSAQAGVLLQLAEWRDRDSVAGGLAYVEVDHLYQGWNNCGATSIAMFARHAGSDATPYDVKRFCPRHPIGTGTDWADLVAAGEKVDQKWQMVTFPNNDTGFGKGVEAIRGHLDAGRPVVIDFTVKVMRNGKEKRFGHTLLVVGYNSERDQFVLKNPNQPPPGIQLMPAEELKENWYSRGYSRLAKGRTARPLIVVGSR